MTDESASDELLEFTDGEQLELLRSNTLALALGTISFLRSQGIPGSEWTSELGAIFARGWDTDGIWTPEDFLDATIINLTAFGGEAVQAEFGDDEATAVIAHFPDPERVAALELDRIDGDVLFDLITPIARACGIRYQWQRDGDHVHVTVSRLTGSP